MLCGQWKKDNLRQERGRGVKEPHISHWECSQCKRAMVTVAWIKPGPPGSSHYRFCRGAGGCGANHLFTSPSGAEQQDFLDFPQEVWANLCVGVLPSDLTADDIEALSAHSQRAFGAYTDAARTALRDAARSK